MKHASILSLLLILTACEGTREELTNDTFRDCADCPEMVIIPAGSFFMGSDDGQSDEQPVHRVDIDYSFSVGIHEVSQAEWLNVMGDNPSEQIGMNLPVEKISWHTVKRFITKLYEKTGFEYRLLTEAEWEYVVRIQGNSNSNIYVVRALRSGVWEWLEDCYQASYANAPVNGEAVYGNNNCNRVVRGGTVAGSVPSMSFRLWQKPTIGTSRIGLRLARTL